MLCARSTWWAEMSGTRVGVNVNNNNNWNLGAPTELIPGLLSSERFAWTDCSTSQRPEATGLDHPHFPGRACCPRPTQESSRGVPTPITRSQITPVPSRMQRAHWQQSCPEQGSEVGGVCPVSVLQSCGERHYPVCPGSHGAVNDIQHKHWFNVLNSNKS